MKRKIKAIALAASMFAQIAANAIVGGLTAFADSGTVTFDISKGSVNITDSTYSGYNSSGTNISGSSAGVSFVITGSTTTNTITMSGTQNITLSDCSIDVYSTGNSTSNTGDAAFGIVDDNTGNVNVTLVGKNKLKSGYCRAGIEKNGGTSTGTLTISGTGSLTAIGNNGAGIGGGYRHSGSNITINSGTVTATDGCNYGVGAGIGGGGGSSKEYISSSSNITITGGTVTATGGSCGGAGIGNGNSGLNGSGILITGGIIKAYGGENGAGIGAGGDGNSDPDQLGGYSNIRITGGTVYAEGGRWKDFGAAGIGGSYMGKQVSGISIEGGTVTAKGNMGGAGIGSGFLGNCSDVTIIDGTVTAIGGAWAAGIGGGCTGDCSDVIITGGSIKATGSGGANNIGSGLDSAVVTSITDGTSDIYLLTLANPNSADVMIDDVSYTPVNHTAANNSDKNLYVYLTGETHNIKVGGVNTTYLFDSTNNKFLPLPEVTAPTAIENLVYNTSEQTLITAGSTSKGTMKYALDKAGPWSTELPKGQNVGTYTVWYMSEGNNTTIASTNPASITVSIDKASWVFSQAQLNSMSATALTYGQTLGASTLSGSPSYAGTYAWKTPTIAPTVADSNRTAFTVIFTPTDTNYKATETTCTITVSKKSHTFTASDVAKLSASDLTYGQTLSQSIISGNKPVDGSYRFVSGTTVPTVNGTNNFAVEFVPTDTDNYEVVPVGNVHVTVNPATLTVTGTGIASGTYGDALNQFIVSGLTVKFDGTEISGSWSLEGTEIPNIPDSNYYTATFTPDENAECFNTLTTNVSLSITADLIISPTNSGDELIYGVDYTYEDTTPRQLIILSSKPITIRNADPNVPTSDTIKIAKDIDANINLAGVNIDGECAIEIVDGSTGDVTITLANGTNNILKSGTGRAGIEKNGNSEDIGRLTINGTGSLTVQGGENAAGIGGGNGKSTANIIIDNGNINAIGGANGAGIGGGANGNGTDITVNNGTVTATGGINGAGIGGGNGGNGEKIIINNGTVNATGGENAAGIGGGQNGHGKNITLAGGYITATGGTNAAGIGGGSNGNLDTLVITGGTVITTGGSGGAGIGGGANGTAADISITGGNISAKGGSYTEDGNIYTGAAIGSGVGRVDDAPVNGIPAEITNGDIITHLLTINVPTGSTIIVDGQTIVTNLHNIGLLLEEPGPHTVTIDNVPVTYIWSDHNNKWMIIPEVTAPTAKTNLKYIGNAQELITAGSTTGGTLEYSLAETEGYSTSIPTGTQANTYTVWYRVVGNDDYTDVAPASIQVTISQKSSSGSGGGSSWGNSGGSDSGSSSATGNTLLNDKPATWSSIADEISKFNKGTSATISMNGETIIPSKVVKAINDTDSKITFKLDGVFSWLIDGADLNSNEPIDLSITRISGVPTTGVDGIVGTQIKLNNNAAGIDLGINFKKEYDNQFANLYKQTSEGLEFVTCSKICDTGYVSIEDVKYAGNYVVMISQFSSKPGDINGDGYLNAKDALAILKHALEIELVRDAKQADVNHDGYINAKDALKVLKVAVGIETM